MNLDERKIVDVNNLIDKSSGDGIASDSDIMKALEDIEYDIEQLEDMGDALDANGIDSPDFLNDRNSELEQSLDLFKNPQKMEKILSSEGISPDDPVRMYLKEIGKIPLLSNEREMYLAEQVSLGSKEAKNELVEKAVATKSITVKNGLHLR